MTLGDEQRCALAMLNALVNQGLATLTYEKVRTGGTLVEVARFGSRPRDGTLSRKAECPPGKPKKRGSYWRETHTN
jgi:hypothetical protein